MGQDKDADIDVPKWDVALASLVRDASASKGGALTIEDFSRIAREHSIRFDDIMETVFMVNGVIPMPPGRSIRLPRMRSTSSMWNDGCMKRICGNTPVAGVP